MRGVMVPGGKSFSRRRDCRGFSLVEVAIALAVIGFSCACLIGLLPVGLLTFRQAMGNTVESEIVQSISNDLRLDNFSTLVSYASSSPSYYYDHDGAVVAQKADAFYQAQLLLTPVGSSNSPVALTSSSAAATPAYNITVTITNVAQSSYDVQHPHLYSLIIANNGL